MKRSREYYQFVNLENDPRLDSSIEGRRIPFTDHHPTFDGNPNITEDHFADPEDFAIMRSRHHVQHERPFLQRVKKWKNKKERRLKLKKSDVKKKEMKKCTFKPSLTNSKITDETRLKSYQRSYDKARRNYILHIKNKEKDMKKNCTFQPNRTKSKSRNTPVRRMSTAASSSNSQILPANKRRLSCPTTPIITNCTIPVNEDKQGSQFLNRISKPKTKKDGNGDPHCTFKPSINKNYFKKRKSSNFLYLGNNAFDRLSRRREKRAQTPDIRKHRRENSIDSRSFTPISSTRKRRARKRSNSTSSGFLRKSYSHDSTLSSNHSRHNISSQSEMNLSKRKKVNIEHFLKRTAERDAERNRRLEILREATNDRPQPKITAKSKQITKNSFQPRINQKSRKICQNHVKFRRRTNDDRHREHQEAKEKIAVIRKEIEEKRMKEVTFKPKINKKMIRHLSKKQDGEQYFRGTNGVNDPEVYMKRIHHQQRKKMRKARLVRKEEAKKEMEHCSFRPKIRKIPTYVSKIARTYELSKLECKKEEKKKEGWK